MTYQATGQAIRLAISTHSIKLLFRFLTIIGTEAPKIFLIQISLVLRSATNDASPNNPKQAMNMARNENIEKSERVCSKQNRETELAAEDGVRPESKTGDGRLLGRKAEGSAMADGRLGSRC